MSASNIWQNFAVIANAPDGVAKMREMVLCLAMQGKLVEQNSADIPARDLLIEVEAEKEKLILEKTLKAPKVLPEIGEMEKVYPLPITWEWVRFGTIALHNSGKTLDQQRNNGEPRDYITTSNLYWGTFDLRSLRQMLIKDDELERCTAIKGDLLICEGGEAGRAAVWESDKEVCFQNHVHRARFYGKIDPYYAYRFFQKLNATGEINQYRKGVGISSMSGKVLASIVFPLPPIAEQKRIVAKVDELMVLCDKLEEQHQERELRFPVLSRTCHERFAEAPTPATLNRIFDETGTVSAADLRRTILTLAVQAKLVPQDRKDEAAGELLERIKAEQKIYAEENRFRTSYEHSVNEHTPHPLPSTWRWARMSSLFNAITDGDHLPPPKSSEGIAFLTIGNVTTGQLVFEGCRFVPKSYYDKLATFRRPLPGDILYTVVGATYGRPAIVETERPFCVQRHIAILKPAKSMEVTFLLLALQSPFVYDQATKSTTGTAQPTIPLSALRNFLLPLPPLAEQRRIVAKVSELMILVSQLETQQQERDKLAEAFAKACVASFTGTPRLESTEKMKAPKAELISVVTLGKKRKPDADAPLATLLD
ncbi:MAG: restriction endonuclease subunit S, partial [Fimbriimonadaceae bacterium]